MKKKLLSIVVALLILAGGWFGSKMLLKSAPKAQMQTPQKKETLVATKEFVSGTQTAVVEGFGHISSRERARVSSMISARVEYLNSSFEIGEQVEQGEVLVRVACGDFENELLAREADLLSAEADLMLARAESESAKEEYAMLEQKLSPENEALVLKKPQLNKAKAQQKKAKAALEQARRNVARCSIKAPVSGTVLAKKVAIGDSITKGMELGELHAKKGFFITLPLAQRDVGALLDAEGVLQSKEAELLIEGRVVAKAKPLRLLPAVDGDTKMKRLLLEAKSNLLVLDDLISVRVYGRSVAESIKLPYAYLRRDGNVWLYKDGKIAIESAEIVHEGAEGVIVRGLGEKAAVITTNLTSPVAGAAVVEVDNSGE